LIVRIIGIRVRASLVTPVLIAVVAGGLASSLDRDGASELVLAVMVFFVAVAIILLHESVRVAVYRRIGVAVRGLDLFFSGGSPSLVDRTVAPRHDVIAGVAGLLPLLALAICSLIVDRATTGDRAHDVTHLLAIAALAFATFQAMPALPLDGGRLMRALVWHLTEDPIAGSRAVAVYGQLVALGMIAGGTLLLTEAGALPYWGFAAIVTGLQVSAASLASFRDSCWQAAGAGVVVSEANLPLPGRIPANSSIESLVDALIEEGDRATLLVVDGAGTTVGIVRLANLKRVRRSTWADTSVAEVMTPLAEAPRLSAELSVLDAITELDRLDTPIAIATLEPDRLILLQRDQLLHVVLDHPAMPS
jgi:Zn-dependent protease